MSQRASDWSRRLKSWAGLKGLHPKPLDLEHIDHIRSSPRDVLGDCEELASLLCRVGLNDEHQDEFPPSLHPYCGRGLRIWQYPVQFAPYLIQLSKLAISSYLEIGIRHGGSFVMTTEYLARFHPLRFAVGVDLIPCPSADAYRRLNPIAEHWCMNTCEPAFATRLQTLDELDLVFIDSHHEEEQCRREVELMRRHARAIALHDICNVGCPGVGRVWDELKRDPTLTTFEYTAQYGVSVRSWASG
jgi:cephalosporin hydroxylase